MSSNSSKIKGEKYCKRKFVRSLTLINMGCRSFQELIKEIGEVNPNLKSDAQDITQKLLSIIKQYPFERYEGGQNE